MIKFQEINIRNFMSYGNVPTIIPLTNVGTTLIKGVNGCGKAQPLDAKIKVPNGWITMGDITIGTKVSTPSGNNANVIGLFPQGIEPVYKITFADGRSTEASGNHLWSVFSHRWGKQKTRGRKIITTLELQKYVNEAHVSVGNVKNIFVDKVCHENVQDVDLPIAPYLLGCLLGDGGLTISSKTPKFTSADNDIVDKVNKALLPFKQRLKRFGNQKIDYTVCNRRTKARGNILRDRLIQLQLWGSYSYEKFIPYNYLLETSLSQKLLLLQGLLDTDGTVGKGGNISFSSTSIQLAKNVQYLIRSIGGTAKISERFPFYKNKNGQRVEGRKSYEVMIGYRYPDQLFSLQRKKSRISSKQQYRNSGLRICAVEYSRDTETQCILIDDPNHLYITDDFVVTHNTSILRAIIYGLYDVAWGGEKIDELINNINKKNMEVTVQFSKGEDTYHITRVRKGGKIGRENTVTIRKNGKDITRDSVNNANKQVVEIMGMPCDTFIRIVVISAEETPFFNMPVTSHYQPNQTDFIERLFNLSILSDKATALKEVIKGIDELIKDEQKLTEALEQEHIRHEDNITDAKKRVVDWERINERTIKELRGKLSRINDVDFVKEQAAHNKVKELTKQIEPLQIHLTKVKTTISDSGKRVQDLQNQLDHLRDDKCPYCQQKYKNTQDKIHQCENEFGIIEHTLKDAMVSKGIVITELERLKASRLVAAEQITVDDLQELYTIKNQSEIIAQKIIDLEQMTNPLLGILDDLQKRPIPQIDYTKITALRKLKDHQEFLVKILTKKDSFVRKKLLNRNLPILNKKLSTELKSLGLPHNVQFTHEMTAQISKFGHSISARLLSHGQRARLNLALTFAFREVEQKLHTPINLCLLDEALDEGLDEAGVALAIRSLKQKARDEQLQVFVISHIDNLSSSFDRTLSIEFNDQEFSVLKEERM